eukprot:jgi/Tetstr1/449766/TSEL_036831.t1
MSNDKRRKLQQEHWGQCRGRPPYVTLPSVLFYIADILHNLLRVVPQIFLHTVSENCDKEQLQVVGQYCYDHLKLIISEDIYLQTEKGVKKLNVAAESLPGATCRTLLDNYDTLLQKAIPHHKHGQKNEELYLEALAVWEAFFLFNDAVTRGCDDSDPAAIEAHAKELEQLGATFMAAFLETATDENVTVYMHLMACHMGDLVRQWGGLMKWCSQGAEAMHQMTKFFARKRSARKGKVSEVVLSILHMLLKMHSKPSRRVRPRHVGKPVLGTGHVPKVKREKHEQTQASLKRKFPEHTFNTFRAAKK